MKKKVAEPDDPLSLEAVSVPGGEPETMAEAFIEEYARLGMTEEEIYLLFARHVYFGTHLYFARRGEEATRRLIRQVISRTGLYRYTEVEHDA